MVPTTQVAKIPNISRIHLYYLLLLLLLLLLGVRALFLFVFFSLIYLFGSEKYREIFHLLIPFPDGHNSQEPGIHPGLQGTSTWSTWAILHYFSQATKRKLN